MRVCRYLTILASGLLILSACGGGDVERDVPLGVRLTSEAATRGVPPLPTAPPVPSVAALPSAAPQPTLDAVAVAQINNLGRLTLTEGDLGPDYAVQLSDRSLRRAIVETQGGIPSLAAFLNGSSLTGAWAALFGRTAAPVSSVGSVVYLFGTPEDARAFVDTFSAIDTTGYTGAVEVQRIQAPAVGDAAIAVRFRTTSGRSLEVLWSQGVLAGQVILRYPEDREEPGDVDRLGALARVQAARMAAALP